MKVVVTGGSGYLGQFIVLSLRKVGLEVVLLYSTRPPDAGALQALGEPTPLHVDLRTGEGLPDVQERFGQPDAVVNCAAVSIPRTCEQDKEAARAVNVPTALLEWMTSWPPSQAGELPLLVHLSTDQVYDGHKSFWKEDDELQPVNYYGQTKVEAEELVRTMWPNHAILRSSIICGPEPPVPVGRGLPLQWMDGVLSSGKATEFFDDEFRNPVYVNDVVQAVLTLLESSTKGYPHGQRTFNMGGPERLSRADMAGKVAEVRGYDIGLIQKVPASSANRGVASPADISMDVSSVQSVLGLALTDFSTVVRQTFRQ